MKREQVFSLVYITFATGIIASVIQKTLINIFMFPLILRPDLSPQGLSHTKLITMLIVVIPFPIYVLGGIYYYYKNRNTQHSGAIIGLVLMFLLGLFAISAIRTVFWPEI